MEPEQPRREPEILAPPDRRSTGWSDLSSPTDAYRRTPHVVYVGRIGPWRVLGILLLLALVAGGTFAVVLGALFVLLPIAAVLVLAGLLVNMLRSSR